MIADLREQLLDAVGLALKVKLAAELDRGRLARQSLSDLTELLARVRPAVDTLALTATDYDTDLDLGDLLAERHPPTSVLDDDEMPA